MGVIERITDSAIKYAKEEISINEIVIYKQNVSYILLSIFIDAFIEHRIGVGGRLSYFLIGALIGCPSNCTDFAERAINKYSCPIRMGPIREYITGNARGIEKGFNFMLYDFDAPKVEDKTGVKSIW